MHAGATLAAYVSGRLRRVGRAALDGVLPPRCLACGETVDEQDALCARAGAAFTTDHLFENTF